MKQNLFVPPECKGIELDEFLALQYPHVPKGRLRRLIREGKVSVNGVVEANPKRLGMDALVIVDLPQEGLAKAAAPVFEIPVLFEDEQAMVVHKPAGLAVEPERWKKEAGSVSQLLIERLQKAAGPEGVSFRPRLAHRLDKGTSGALLIAKTLEAERELRRQFEHREVEKEYWALVQGEVPGEGGEIDLPLGEDSGKPGRMRVQRRGGDEAFTSYKVVERFRGWTLLAAFPKTGRTHQIRVHLASRGFPLAVDEIYGERDAFHLSAIKRKYRLPRGHREKPLLTRLSLHASRIRFVSPASGPTEVVAPLPKDLAALLERLRRFVRLP